MKKRFVLRALLTSFLAAMVFVAGCDMLMDKQDMDTGDWYISLPSGDDGNLDASYWKPSDVVLYKVFLAQAGAVKTSCEGKPGEKLELKQLTPGVYDVTVEGYNAADEVIADGGGTVSLQEGKDANITVTLSMHANTHTYTVSYDYNAVDDTITGTLPPAKSDYVYQDTVTVMFPPLTRTGYDFAGWNTKADGSGTTYTADADGEAVTFEMQVSDVVLYARWQPKTYTVTLSADDATTVGTASVTATFGRDLPITLEFPQREGFSFGGFFTSQNGLGVQYYSASGTSARTWDIAEDTTLYAHWGAADTTYTVLHLQQPSSGATALDAYEVVDTQSAVPGKTGERTSAMVKSYTGFDTPSAEDVAAWQQIIASDGSTVVKLYYNRSAYTVTFDGNGSTSGVTAAQTYYYGVSQTLTANGFTHTGYIFAGWGTSADGAKQYDDGAEYTIGAGNVTLYAIWNANTYTVTLDEQGATSAGTASVSVTYDSTMPAISVPEKEGYIFRGYYAQMNGGGTQYYDANGKSVRPWDIATDTMLYAYWTTATSTQYKVEHYQQNKERNGYTPVLADTQTLTGETGTLTTATANSYTGFDTPAITQTTITADGLTVVPIYYNRTAYTVTFDGNGSTGGEMVDQTFYYGVSQALTVNGFVRTGYSFVGWATSADGAKQYADGASYTIGAGNATLYATWTANNYTATLDGQEATAAGTASVIATYDSAMPQITVPSKTGYVFMGYYTQVNGGGTQYYDASGTGTHQWEEIVDNPVLYAYWTVAGNTKYIVKHLWQNTTGNTEADYTVHETEELTGATDATTAATAKTYDGFVTPTTVTQQSIKSDGSTVVEIKYDRAPYTVTFNGNGSTGGETADQTFYYDVPQSLTANGFTRTGYDFAGWATSADGAKQYADGADYTIGVADVTLYALWTAKTYTVTLDGQGATTAGTGIVTATYDSAMPAITALPVRTGYTFAGFFTAANGSGTQYYSAAGESLRTWNIAENTTLYAHWTEAGTSYTVKHYQQNTDHATYTLVDTETPSGTTGAQTAARAKTYDGFVTPTTVTQQSIKSDGSTVIEIKYDRAPYTVSFDKNNTNAAGTMADQTYYYGVPQTLATNNFARTGYTFAGWATSADGAKQYADGASYTIGAGNATLYATWKANAYTVTLSATDATTAGTASVTATYDRAMPAISSLPARTGYTFAGFFAAANGGGTQYYSAAGESLRSWDMAADTTLYAHWTEATTTQYKVEHYQQNIDNDNYTLVTSDTQTLTGTTGATTAASAKTYTGFNTPTVTQATIAADGSTVVKLYYTRKTFTVTYTAGSGITSGVSGMPTTPLTYRYGASVTVASETPTRSGYTFNGWNLDSDTTTKHTGGETVISEIDANHTLTAVWTQAGGITITVAEADYSSISQSVNGNIVTLTLSGVPSLDPDLTTIDGISVTTFNASHNNSVTIVGNKLICDTSSWVIGSYQVTLCYLDTSMGIPIPQSHSATIKVE